MISYFSGCGKHIYNVNWLNLNGSIINDLYRSLIVFEKDLNDSCLDKKTRCWNTLALCNYIDVFLHEVKFQV